MGCVFLCCVQACSANSSAPPPAADMQSSGGAPPTAATSSSSGGAALPTPSSGGAPAGSGPRDGALFAWPESSADGGASRCQPGHYVGTYSCTVHNSQFGGDAGLSIPIDGPVDLVLNRGQSGEFLTVSGGTLKSAAAGFFQLSASITGQLDCTTGAFTGRVTMGEVSIPPLPPGGNFDATMDGALDGTNQAMSGSWLLTGTTTLMGWFCTGPWKVSFQGP